jgi:hypothetical protein
MSGTPEAADRTRLDELERRVARLEQLWRESGIPTTPEELDAWMSTSGRPNLFTRKVNTKHGTEPTT